MDAELWLVAAQKSKGARIAHPTSLELVPPVARLAMAVAGSANAGPSTSVGNPALENVHFAGESKTFRWWVEFLFNWQMRHVTL